MIEFIAQVSEEDFKKITNGETIFQHCELVRCKECRYCEEQGGHANCDGYLYCTRQRTLVDESCYCSWGERREP